MAEAVLSSAINASGRIGICQTCGMLKHSELCSYPITENAMTIRSFLEKASQLGLPVYRYGMLVLLLGLLAADIRWDLYPSSASDTLRYGNAAVVFLLLLQHLAFQFKWPRHVTVLVRVAFFVWMICVAVYISYLLWTRSGRFR
jgi:hypothetical protein